MTGEGYRFLAHLPALKDLGLCIENPVVADIAYQHVGRCQGLTTLNLNQSEGTQAGFDQLAPLTNLTFLDVGDCGITNLGFLSGMQRLEKLIVSSNQIHDSDLLNLNCHTTLKQLSLANTGVTDGCGPILSQFHDLEDILISRTNITDAILPYLLSLPKLISLAIWDTKLTPDCVRYLKGMTQLHHLMLPKGLLSDAEWESLQKSLDRTRLSEVKW